MANVPSLSVVRDQARPKKLGRYELEECLGAEGGRETYRARVRGLAGFDRFFAVRCLRRAPGVQISRTDPFLLTAKRLTTASDARVARVLDADLVDGVAIAVSEFVHGLDLERFREWAQVSGELATGTDTAAQKWQKIVAYIGTEIAGALSTLHALTPPMVHGGLSPRNVIISTRGAIKLLDVGMGIAAQKGGDPLSPRALAYAAPLAPNVEPNAAGDVRALGAMLFELATGEIPTPGMSSGDAKRMLDPLWPSMADTLAGTLAEDPGRRPRAARVAELLAAYWAEIPDASMITEVSALVRNFSAFVSDSAGTGGPVPATSEPAAAAVGKGKPPSGASGLLTMPPPPPSSVSGSFLISNEPTKVNSDEGYASAIFQATAAEVAPPSAPEPRALRSAAPPVRATLGPGAGRGAGGKVAGAGTGALPPRAATPSPKSSVKGVVPPMKNAAPPVNARTLIMSPTVGAPPPVSPSAATPMPPMPPAPLGKAPPMPPPIANPRSAVSSSASPAGSSPAANLAATPTSLPPLPPSPAMPPPHRSAMPPAMAPAVSPLPSTLPAMPPPLAPVQSPFPSTLSPALAPLASPAPSTLPQPSAPAAPFMPDFPPPLPGVSLAPPPDVQVSEAEPEPVAEAADWGAQALVSLGTQAGVRIPTAAPPTSSTPGGAPDLAASGFGPPLGNGAMEGFAFAPPPAPADQWPASQAPSRAGARAPTQAMGLAPPPHDGSLEDQLVEDEQDSSQYAEGMDSEAISQPDGVFREIAPPPEEGLDEADSQGQGAVLEATAFSVEGEQEEESAPYRSSQEMSLPSISSHRPATPRSALRSHSKVEDEALGEESWRPGMSRKKKIIIVTMIAAGFGAAAASLVLALTDKSPRRHSSTIVAKRVTKRVSSSAARAVKPAESATPEKAALPGPSAPPAKATGTSQSASAEKAVAAGKSAAAGKPAVAAKVAVAAKPAGLGSAFAPAGSSTKSPTPKPVAAMVGAGATAAKGKEAATTAPVLPAVAPGGSIRVKVASQPPGAAVWINGQERGATPCTVALKPGPARVLLVRAGHLSNQSTLEVREGAKIDATLTPVKPPMIGDARFRAECKTQGKLPIVVDGKETGIMCPFSKMRVDPGTHKIGLLVPATGQIHTKEVILFAGVRSIVFGD